MNGVLCVAYWIAVVEYIYNSISTSKKCGLRFTSQLTFWIGLGWAMYFTYPKPDGRMLFALIVMQFIVTMGRLYELKDKRYVTVNYSGLLFHWVGFIIATYYLTEANPVPNAELCVYIFTAYILTFLSYSAIHKKEIINDSKCVPERFFNIYSESDRYRIIILILVSFLVYLITAFTVKNKKNIKKPR